MNFEAKTFEIQKNPRLLNVVQSLIQKERQKFVLTGSSARKLKRGAANLLAGRARLNTLYPLTSQELSKAPVFYTLSDALHWGSLPEILAYSDDHSKQSQRKDYLKSYTRAYVKEEVVAEQLVRNLNPFRGFLEIAAQMNGEILNATNIARDVGVDHKTVQSYFQILVDTHMGFFFYQRRTHQQERVLPKVLSFTGSMAV